MKKLSESHELWKIFFPDYWNDTAAMSLKKSSGIYHFEGSNL